MAILQLKPAYKDYIWGGHRLVDEYGKDFDGPVLAESWELSCHPDGPSVIARGPGAGQTLRDYLRARGPRALGRNCEGSRDFPILIKLIDAKADLSVQVHPDNAYAMAREGQLGKTEMWYVLDARPGAHLYYGFRRPISREAFRRRIAEGTLLEALNAVPVRRGDLFYIPAGTLHAIGKGIVIAEIQQSSNLTYRVYDYGRLGADGKPRPLHIDQAVECTRRVPPRTDYRFGSHLARSDYFTVDLVHAPWEGVCDDASFTSVLVISGAGAAANGGDVLPCRKGDSLFLPAGSGAFSLSGDLEALITRVGTP